MNLKRQSEKCKHRKKKASAKGLTISISSCIPSHQDPLPAAPDELNDLPKPTAVIHPLLPWEWEINILNSTSYNSF